MKKALSIILTVVMIMCVLPFSITASATTSGITGDCTWNLNGTVLTISGNGTMGDYDDVDYNGTYCTTAPWGTSITKVIIEDGVTNIGDYAFDGCTALTNVTIPDSVKSIGFDAFYGCSNLININIPDSVTAIEISAFYGCKSLTNLTLPSNITYISYSAFAFCTGLTKVTIQNGVTDIGEAAFINCSGLTSVVIPKSVTCIDEEAFYGCDDLTDVYYEGNEVDWENIQIRGLGNYAIKSTNIHYNYIPVKFGLVTDNKEISAVDALAILQATVGKITFAEKQIKLADVNGDSQLTAIDSLLVLQYSVRKIAKFPVEM